LLKNALQNLPSKQGITVKKLEFELKLLHLLGVFPQLESCVICTKPITQHKGKKPVLNQNLQYLMDVVQGGIRCQECFGRDSKLIPLNPGSLMFLNRWHETLRHSKDPSIVPTRQNIIEINPIIQASFKLHFPRLPKAHALLEKGLEAHH
ncbi:MAG: DNA repair protein RecO C-terminal domain-containing protein, partial [Deltaproteobacteria bacterium]|nr:DNA repair protein RecO C-terminal domain-containing protein [Deltaproteobacteria bacterium]